MKSDICRGDDETFVRGERGAVMLMGLFFAMFLIAGMWAMKGLGDAVVFRQRMQEAADHETYAAAVVHARGMNLVAALNVLMRILALLYLVMSVLRDLLVVAMALLGACAAIPWTAALCGSLFAVSCNAYKAIVQARSQYESFVIKPVLPALSGVQTAAAIGYPWLASVKAAGVGDAYDASAITVGSSHVPGLAFDVATDSMFDGSGDSSGEAACRASSSGRGTDRQEGASETEKDESTKLGLPVVNAENAKLCELAADSVVDYFPGFLGAVLAWVAGAFNDAGSYCSGFPWETESIGWKRMYKPAKNGSAYMQVWGVSLPPGYDDRANASKVALGHGSKVGLPMADKIRKTGEPAKGTPFFAQAEMFYACKGTWASKDCNGSAEEESFATFNMKWRARLRPVGLPKAGPFRIRDMIGLAERASNRFGSDGHSGPGSESVHDAGGALLDGLGGTSAHPILH